MHDHDHADGPAHGHSHRHESRRAVLRSGLAAGMTAALPRLAWANAPGVASDMGRAAGTWLSRLDQRQKREARETRDRIEQDPFIVSVMAAWPGAEIVSIRNLPQPEAAETAAPDEAESDED